MLLCALVGMFLAVPGMVPLDVLVFGLYRHRAGGGLSSGGQPHCGRQIDKRMAPHPATSGGHRSGGYPLRHAGFSAVTGIAGMADSGITA